MAFVIPEFPLTCDIYTGPWLTKVIRLSSECNLGQGKRVFGLEAGFNPTSSALTNPAQLLLPALTDIRDLSCAPANDIVEVPQGSGRWYAAVGVDDIGKGFPNEHRFAYLVKIYDQLNTIEFAGATWPTPIP